MYNWSTDEKKFKKEDPLGYSIWRIEQMINYGLGSDKLNVRLVKKYWKKISMDDPTKKYLRFLLWPKKSTFLPKSKKRF
ncbi:MAG TPA: hypothetical protein VI998_04450 [Patescibacteria group bacterium]|nr:hypothetical protein [Patescibacteria group bacterium]